MLKQHLEHIRQICLKNDWWGRYRPHGNPDNYDYYMLTRTVDPTYEPMAYYYWAENEWKEI